MKTNKQTKILLGVRNAMILYLRELGFSLDEIGFIFGISKAGVHKVLKKLKTERDLGVDKK